MANGNLRQRGFRVLSLIVVLAAIAILSKPGFAQTEVSSSDGLATATFKAAQGTIQVNLPDEMLGPVSGTIRVFPAGQTAEEKARNLDILNSYTVRAQDKDTRVAAGAFRRMVFGNQSSLDVAFVDRAGKEVSRAAIPVKAPPMFLCVNAVSPKIVAPRTAQAGRSFQIQSPGLFDGDSISTTVKLNGREAEVLAENNQKAIVECPTGVTGRASLQIKKNQTEFQQDLRVLDVSLKAPKLDLRSGEQTTLTAEVKGLSGLQEQLTLRLQNQTPSVVQLDGGDSQNISIQPSEVRGDNYTCTRTVTGKRPGGFNLTATVQDPGPVTVPIVAPDQILTTEPSANPNKGPNANTREEYFLPAGVAEVNRAIAQQQWASPNPNLQGRNPCCCCCCGWWPYWGGPGGGGPGPGPGPGPNSGPSPITTNVNLGADKFGPGKSIYVFAAPATPISGLKYHGEAYVQWNVSAGSGQLTVDVEVQRPGSTRWDKLVTGRGPNDEYLFTADAPGTYLFRVTGKDSTGNSNFGTLSITFPHIPGIA